MESWFVSLLWIALCAVIAPLMAGTIPRKLVDPAHRRHGDRSVRPRPGPDRDAITLLRELGLGMLFLLAGFEIELDELTGRSGRRALITWGLCFGIALVLVFLGGTFGLIHAEVAVAIALCSTASAGQMSSANASVLVAGGAVTTLAMPLLATLLGGRTRTAAKV